MLIWYKFRISLVDTSVNTKYTHQCCECRVLCFLDILILYKFRISVNTKYTAFWLFGCIFFLLFWLHSLFSGIWLHFSSFSRLFWLHFSGCILATFWLHFGCNPMFLQMQYNILLGCIFSAISSPLLQPEQFILLYLWTK